MQGWKTKPSEMLGFFHFIPTKLYLRAGRISLLFLAHCPFKTNSQGTRPKEIF